jgi:lambda family phage portal protein
LRIEQYTNAELTAASINAMLTVFLEKDMPSDEEPFEVEQSGAISLGNGAIVDLAPGERANMVDPTRPNVNFNNFVISIIRQIGAALEIPGDEILLHYDSSYSAARAVMLEAWKFYLTRREYFADQFCRRIYSEWLDDAVELDRVNLPGYNRDYATRRKYQQSRWIGPARGAIDELKEAQAAELRINIGVSSIAREAAAMSGDDWDTIHRELVYEQRARMEGGLIE